MNLELLDPFRNSFPEVIEETFEEEDKLIIACAFNRRGTLLAAGCADGRCIIWDFETRGISRIIQGHKYVTSVSWARSGRKILTSSVDRTLRLWDVVSGKEDLENPILFDTIVIYAQMHPRNEDLCIACPFEDLPTLVELKTGKRTKLVALETEDNEQQDVKKSKTSSPFCASFNKKGDRLFIGTAKGSVIVLDTENLNILFKFKVAQAPIKSIQFSRSGKDYLVNSMDRAIRLIEGEDSKVVAREFQDPVAKIQWSQCAFSADGDHIIAGSAEMAQHKIYIWERQGRLIRNLEGPKDGIKDLLWHPTRPILVSVSVKGAAYIWASNYTENWSAFAPDFKELDENEEYIEREDEFDIEDEDAAKRRRVEEDCEVDVVTVDKLANFSSDEEDSLFFIPIEIEKDEKENKQNNNG